ncbi:MAG: hypothetical protein WC421_05860 [Elusimicrobiales bacterium]
MAKNRPGCLAALAVAVLCAPARADTIRLSGGGVIKGSVIYSDAGSVKILSPSGEITLDKASVLSVTPERYIVRLKDGSSVSGELKDIDSARITLKTAAGEMAFSRDFITSITPEDAPQPPEQPVAVSSAAASAAAAAAPAAATAATAAQPAVPATLQLPPAQESLAAQPAAANADTSSAKQFSGAAAQPVPRQTPLPEATETVQALPAAQPQMPPGRETGWHSATESAQKAAAAKGNLEAGIGYMASPGLMKNGLWGELAYMLGYDGYLIWDGGLDFGAALAFSKADSDISGFTPGSLTVIPLEARARLFFGHKAVRPFILLGAGYYMFSNKSTPPPGQNESVGNCTGFMAGLGVSGKLFGRLNVSLSAAKRFAAPEATIITPSGGSLADQSSRTLDFSPVTGLLSLTLDF